MEIGDKEDHLACEVFIFSYFNSTYLGPFIVVLDRMKYTQHDLARWVVHCGYNIFLVKMLTQWRGTHCFVVHSPENNTLYHSARVQWR